MKNEKWKMKLSTFYILHSGSRRRSMFAEPMLPASSRLAAGFPSGPAHVDQVAVVADRKGLSQLRLDGRPGLGRQCRTALRVHAPEREKLVGPDVRWQVAIVRPFVLQELAHLVKAGVNPEAHASLQ